MIQDLTPIERENLTNARILYYDFFYGLFVFEMLDNRGEVLKQQLQVLSQALIDENLLENIQDLQNEVSTNNTKRFIEEHSKMFALPFGAKQVGMHLSHYYENCVGGDSLLKIKALVKQSDVRVDTSLFKETEEHLGFICGFISYLLKNNQDELAKEVFLLAKDAFFGLCKELQERRDSDLYLDIALILESFLKFESEIIK